MAKKELLAAMADLGLEAQATFVPFSQSRNAKKDAHPKDMGLNWSVTLLRNGREVLTTDYSAGIGHCPSYKQSARWTIAYTDAIQRECETGYPQTGFPSAGAQCKPGSKQIQPDFCSVLASLALDSDVIDHPTFESWAEEFGYDTDSRKAEAIYRACLEIALKLRAALGENGLQKLRDAAQDY